ncbi:MAG: hypothetical protein QOH45_3898, partial [Pseudonocardiales bacterium]|nr:hypothetical protein [Pseudonocardiales bacterium]
DADGHALVEVDLGGRLEIRVH